MRQKLMCIVAMLVPMCCPAQERIILLNEGNWQADNGKVTYFANGDIVSNQWFRDVNGEKLGDTPNDIVQAADNLIAIAVNWSNIVQFIDCEGRAVAATEDVPNNRKLATDGSHVYVTSYGHECRVGNTFRDFTRGFVAKIDLSTFQVTETCEVGYEPEGIAHYGGHLFVANTGGYAFQEAHDYETTVDIIDAATMKIVRSIDTGQINLYGKMSQSGRYLCINSPGNYYDVPASTIILDCEAALNGAPDGQCFVRLDYAATYSCTAADGSFYAIGSRYSYYTGEYEFNYVTIDPQAVMSSAGAEGVYDDRLPGTVLTDIQAMGMPYGIYVNPYTGYIYATDAGPFAAAGAMYQWSPEGRLLGKHHVYINPAHFLALKPDGGTDGIGEAMQQGEDGGRLYDLQGRPVARPRSGLAIVRSGNGTTRKVLMK